MRYPLTLETVVSVPDHIVSRTIDGKTLVIDITRPVSESNLGYSILNNVGRTIWQHIDGSTTIGQIVEAVVEVYEIDRGTAERDTIGFVTELLGRRYLAIQEDASHK